MKKIMVNGLPGKMGHLISSKIIEDSRFELIPISLTGPDIAEKSVTVADVDIRLVPPEEHSGTLDELNKNQGDFIIVDYTHPSAVHVNAALYCSKEIPFVMGTTGGDMEKLNSIVINSSISAVIAPNMAGEVVAMAAMFEYMSENFPGLFSGAELSIRESHQKGKADTSGTAKSMVGFFNALGVDFDKNDIEMIRDPEEQRRIGVPEEFLTGHGWHTYTLSRPDKSILLQFKHNINGRPYYSGTASAVIFLEKKINEGNKGRVYSMLDVLKDN